jgi:hypothetical protein
MVDLELLVDPYPTQRHQLREPFIRANIIPPSPRRNHETFCQSATTLQPKKGLTKRNYWCEVQRALEALLFQFSAHFIGKGCQWC